MLSMAMNKAILLKIGSIAGMGLKELTSINKPAVKIFMGF